MRLVIDKCSHCNRCVEVCPHKANFECRHCKDAPCVKACPRDAFYEVMPDVWSVDPERCDGCGLCAAACPYNAIYIDGYARKCDLCGGKPKCVGVCPLGLRLEETPEEIKERKRILGWEKISGQYETGIYAPSYQESKLIGAVVRVFREMAKEKEVEIEIVFDDYCEEMHLALEPAQRERLLELMGYEVHGLSILEPMLADDELEEITVSGTGEPVRVYKRGVGWLGADVAFASEKKIVSIINKIARPLGRRITLQKPRLNASLADGSRLHAAIPPVAESPTLTIRKFKQEPMTARELIDNRTISAEAMAFLWAAMQCGFNILVAGSTGSGKTTTLNTLAAFIPLDERVVVVEETPEIRIPHKHMVRLVVNEELGLGMNRLVGDTLRMRPDRVIIGEVRTSEEAKALMNTMLAGQGKGSIATFHALSGREAINRMRSLGIAEADLASIGIIVVQKRWDRYDTAKKKGKELRRIMEISEIAMDGGKAVPRKLFDYDYKSDRLQNAGWGEAHKKIMGSFSVGKKELTAELARRERALMKSSRVFGESVEGISNAIFG